MEIADREWLKLKEIVEVLAGMRGDKRLAALRSGEISNLQEVIGQLKKGATSVTDDLIAINNKLQQVQSGLSTTQDDLTATRGELAQTNQQVADVQQQLGAAQQQLTQLNANLDAAQSRIDQIAEGSSTAQQDINAVKANVGRVATPAPTKGTIAVAPTADDFNALVSDIQSLYQQIVGIKNGITA